MSAGSLVLLACVFFLSCTGTVKETENELVGKIFPAQWITDGRPLPDHDSLFYLDHPAPLFRKAFTISSGIREAKLYITSAGYYLASLNGQSIGRNVLDGPFYLPAFVKSYPSDPVKDIPSEKHIPQSSSIA